MSRIKVMKCNKKKCLKIRPFLDGVQGVGGSNPLAPTKKNK